MHARIPTAPPPAEFTYSGMTCGADVAFWMDDTLPAFGDPPKEVVLKMAYLGSEDYDTDWREAARVVACSDSASGGDIFYLYHLEATYGCNLCYCATTLF